MTRGCETCVDGVGDLRDCGLGDMVCNKHNNWRFYRAPHFSAFTKKKGITCRTCHHYEPVNKKKTQGDCIAHPPTPFYEAPTFESSGDFTTLYPRVAETNRGCGEWEEKRSK